MTAILGVVGLAALFALFGVLGRGSARWADRSGCSCATPLPACGGCRVIRDTSEGSRDER